MIEIKEVLTLIAILLTIGGMFWGFIRWTINKIETSYNSARSHTDDRHSVALSHISRIDTRVNEVRDEYVKRADLDRDFKSIERQLDALRKDQTDGRAETNQRLDRMLMLLGKVISNHNDPLD